MSPKRTTPSRTEAIGSYLAQVFGGVILVMGIYLTITGEVSSGHTLAGRMGTGGGEPISIPGWGFIAIGAFLFIPGVIWLISKSIRRR